MSISLRSQKGRALFALWAVEMTVLFFAVCVAAWIRFVGDSESYRLFAETAPIRTFLVAISITLSMAAFGLYQANVRRNRMETLLRLLLSFAFGGVALLVLFYLMPQTYIGRGVLLIALTLALVCVILVRVLSEHVFSADLFKQKVLVLGAGANADLLYQRMRRRADRQSFVLIGFVPLPGQTVIVPEAVAIRPDMPLVEYALSEQIDEIVVAPDERRGGLPMADMLACVQRGITMTDLSTFFEREAGMVKLDVVDPSWLVFSGGFDQSATRRLSKRFFDLIAATALLLVAWPFMLLVALAVWLETGAPIFYSQTRVGRGGKPFDVIKFRSMRVDAEGDGKARWATKNDDRTTRVGRFIRLTRLDELPQLFNVLRGDMSFVGPRPERPQFVEQLNQEIRYYDIRHSVKPGLTGWAQLRYPYGASVRDAEEKLKFDLFYVKNQGMLFDVMIMLQTVEVVLFGRGAR
ncbi:MAG: sugar transferase [Gammaproteobacteria bacterium HGW-Gammaproteobacteria-2]|jgi:sugar transferase (PEP-CTERM system associated)|nr:MAG: sugar transferase [Gammaproteobacteria bacterium HGW-Gammaproteobacteria-2]